jgi:hypothetical protein
VERDAPRIPVTRAPPPALAAKIHAPAVSELRKPRPSRRTPPGGMVPGNVLQQIVGAQASEPMPVPRAGGSGPPAPAASVPVAGAAALTVPLPTPPTTTAATAPPLPPPPHVPAAPPPNQFPSATPGAQAQYIHDASGLPMAMPTPSGLPAVQTPSQVQAYPGPPGASSYPGYPPQPYGPGQPISPGGLYQFSPYGQPPLPLSLTGQLRLSEIDEIPSHFKIRSTRRRWYAYIVAGLIAVSAAAGTTFLIISATRETAPPTTGSVHIESVPPGGEVYFNGTRLTDRTPLTIEGVPVGTRHDIRVEMPRHKAYEETIDIPKTGGEISVTALMKPITGKIVVNSQPGGAEIWINDQLRGRTPTTLNDIDMAAAKKIELRLKGYEPVVADLDWPANGQISLDVKLQR